MSEFQKSIVAALGQYLAAAVPELQQVIPEWPTANTTLKYPSLTLTTAGNVNFTPLQGSVSHQGETDDGNRAVIRYLAGHWEVRLQLDLWTQSKPQRSTIFEKVLVALNPDPNVMGIRVRLNDYYNEWAGYSVTGYELPDGPEASQRNEWRALISVNVLCNAIFEKNEYIISQVILEGEPTANYDEEL